jgi:hypothetical protein
MKKICIILSIISLLLLILLIFFLIKLFEDPTTEDIYKDSQYNVVEVKAYDDNFENVDDFKIHGKDLLNRTIMGLNMNINTDGRYEFSLETYDCTPSSTDIFDCVILNFKCYNLCILDED